MTVQNAIDIVNVLQDKYGSPYLTTDELLYFLDMAQQERLNRLFPDDMGGVVNVEQDENTLSNVKKLIYYITSGFTLTTNGAGSLLEYQDIDQEIDNGSGKLFRILNVEYNGYPVRYTKHNNLISNQNNVFKQADEDNPRYTILSQGLQFYPSSVDGSDLTLTVIKKPYTFASLYTIDPYTEIVEWDDYNMNLIIMITLQLAGVSTRDEELLLDIRNTQTTK